MEQYTRKTQGSVIIEKESYITWDYRQVNFVFGKLQAKELADYVESVFGYLPIILVQS